MAIAVTTRSYDNARSGANIQETELTAQAVTMRGIRRLFSLQVPNDARGIEAQPLVVPGVTLDDGSIHDVLYLASMANQVLAFDLKDGQLLWQRLLGTPINPGQQIDGHTIDAFSINDHWGVLSTPVIDRDTGTMYLVAWISPDGTIARAQHVAFAISIRNGQDVHPSLSLEGVVYNPGHAGGQPQSFNSAVRKQRASLLLTSVNGVKTVFAAFGSILETSRTARGWIIACSTNPFEITAAWASVSSQGGSGAGIWQAGAGLAADAQGFIYAMTGNGNFDAVTDWGESFIKLQYTPPGQGAAQGSLEIVDWWTPWTDRERVGGASPRAHSVLEAHNATAPRSRATNFRPYAAAARCGDSWDDMDLGSGGPVVISSQGAVVGAGKDGILYVLNQNNMGKTQPADLNNPATNYARLKSPPIFFTYFANNLSPAPQNIQEINTFFADRTHHLHGNPLYWESPDLGPVLYCWGENGNLRAWSVHNDGSVSYLACSAEVASAQAPVPCGGMPGGMLTLSANGNQPHTGVVWALIPYKDANKEISAGRLLAYDATQFGRFSDGSAQLQVLWDSERWAIPFTFNKFNPPVVANGRLIVPRYDAHVDVYGL